MSERGDQLFETADRQIGELIGFVSQTSEPGLSRACPSRDKLGDGTVGALASHTADSYLRIAAFLKATNNTSPARSGPLRALSHTPPRHADSGRTNGMHAHDYTAENVDLAGLLERLSAGRAALSLLADLTAPQLDTVPPAGSFRFCDGQRTLEHVIASLLKHQGHQIDAIKSATR